VIETRSFNVPIIDDDLKHFALLPKLRVLDVSYTRIGDAGLRHVGQVKGLRSLTLSGLKLTRPATAR
jgi:hypothetical protein